MHNSKPALSITILALTVLILVTSCSQPTSNPAGGLQINTSDPVSVLQAIPDELALAGSVGGTSGVSTPAAFAVPPRASAAGLEPQVFHDSAEYSTCVALEDIANASMSFSINLILKNISRFDADIIVDSGAVVTLGDLVLSNSIAEAINMPAGNHSMTFHGVIVNSISSADSPSGIPGFAYYMPVTFVHGEPGLGMGEVTIYPYFEVFTQDANNMVMRYSMYVESGETYYKYMTSVMEIENGRQWIQRFENDLGDDSDWWYMAFENNPSNGSTVAWEYRANTTRNAWTLIAADADGGMIALNNDTSPNLIRAEYFDKYGIMMAMKSDSDAGSSIPADFSAFMPDGEKYAYRYLENNTGDIGDTVIENYKINDTTVDVPMYYSAEVTDPASHLFLLGSTNASIISNAQGNLTSAYPNVKDYFDGSITGVGTLLNMMAPINLGVDNHSTLKDMFELFGL